jgi:TetR/AcrR family transcriptional repressor of bet genes
VEPERKYRRVKPALRREHLVTSTLRCLAEQGAAGASIRRIAAAAGVSTGLINHHYAHLEDLVAEAYDHLATRVLRDILAGVAEAGGDPRQRLTAFFTVSFSAAVLDPDYLSAWLVFWSMIRHSEAMKTVHTRTNEEYRRSLGDLLADLIRDRQPARTPDLRLAAAGLSALLDGLWLAWCLNPQGLTAQEGVAICEDWVEAHLR